MKQGELEQKVREIFERQGFEVEKDGNRFTAENGEELVLKVFSSEEFTEDEVLKEAEEDAKIFVDEGLEHMKKEIGENLSVIREDKEEPDYDTPSYELIGDIAVINDLAGVEREEAVKGITHHHPKVKTVLLKKEGLKGEFRVGEYEKLYGEETETVHREFDCRFRVDPTEAYYSERFSTERKRVVDKIEEEENVLVMFAGVGPFAIMAAKLANPKKVVAIEKNPKAANYLRKNIRLNSVEDTVEAIEGDVSKVVPELGERFDRIIMPLPGTADRFLELAFRNMEDEGIIHYYRFLKDEDWESIQKEIEDIANGSGFEVLDRTVCGNRSARIDRVCIEIRRKRK